MRSDNDNLIDATDRLLGRAAAVHIVTIGEFKEPLLFRKGCVHTRHLLDRELHRVECADCGEVLDPIMVIESYIRYWQSMKYELEQLQKLRAEQKRLAQEKEDRRMARYVAKHGGVWASSTDGSRITSWDGGKFP